MADIRDFEPVLPNPQPYIEKAVALYKRTVSEKRGHVVFITAELGGGKTEHLSAIAKALRHAKPEPNFTAGFFRNGEYNRYTLDWQENICLGKALTAAGSIASLLGLFPIPYAFAANFVGQLIGTSVSAQEFANAFKKKPPPREDSAGWLRDLLRRASRDKPLICLLDDWDEAQPRLHWDSMLLSFAREINQDVPLLLFITLREPSGGDAPKADSGLASIVKSLTEKGVSEWWRLKKLSRDEVGIAIGETVPDIASELHQVTGGNARWVRELWQEWRLREVVVPDQSDRWVWGEKHKTTVNLYESILRDRLTQLLKAGAAMEVEQAHEILACAALEGVHFTADAVALALDRDRDELVDFLDEVLVQDESNPEGLLIEASSTSFQTQDGATRTLCQYSFVSDLHWMALERYGFANDLRPIKKDSEREEKIKALIKALREVYAPEERLVAAKLALLLRQIGDEEEAQTYQRMADYGTAREVTREQALYLLSLNKDDWNQWQCERSAQFLIEAGRLMINTSPHDETLAVFAEASMLAHRAQEPIDEGHAHYLSGFVLNATGQYDLARKRALDSLKIFSPIGKKDGVALSLHLLSQIFYAEGHYGEAQQRAEQALKIDEEIANRPGVASSLHMLAFINRDNGNYDRAREQATQALRINDKIGNRNGSAISLNLLAQVEGARGNYAEASRRAAQALKVNQEIGNRQGTASSCHLLAQFHYDQLNYSLARKGARLAVNIHQEIGNLPDAAASLELLAQIDSAEGNYAQARQWATQALGLHLEIGDQHGAGVSLGLLGAVANKLGLRDEAFDLISLGILVLPEISAHRKKLQGDLATLAAERGYTEVKQRELSQELLRVYLKDGGTELIKDALTKLREVEC